MFYYGMADKKYTHLQAVVSEDVRKLILRHHR
jgi:hypothetical protein